MPEQNGMAERMNRTLVEMTRCMLKDSSSTFDAIPQTANCRSAARSARQSSFVKSCPLGDDAAGPEWKHATSYFLRHIRYI